MTRRTKANVAIALLLMALTLVGCNPSTGGPGSADEPQVAIMKAVSQAMASVNTTSPESNHVTQDGNTYNVTSFTADDGSRIDGSFISASLRRCTISQMIQKSILRITSGTAVNSTFLNSGIRTPD